MNAFFAKLANLVIKDYKFVCPAMKNAHNVQVQVQTIVFTVMRCRFQIVLNV